jgi:hypothetical protein
MNTEQNKELNKQIEEILEECNEYDSKWGEDNDGNTYGGYNFDMEKAVKALSQLISTREMSGKNWLNKYIQERLKQHRDNLELWENGVLTPTEPDEVERNLTKEGLRACIYELEELEKYLSSQSTNGGNNE